ncbi:MAG TPA: diguanylate cyclase [Peptococcaceae bacterium]|nr:diguanylate cyclase [Peptococcaceae bacterium]
MLSVGKIMTKKLITVAPSDSVEQAVVLMNRFRVGGLPVVEKGKLVGIITSKDVRSSHPNRIVGDAMSRDVVVVSPDCSLWEAKRLMEEHAIERLIVVDGEKLVGIVTKSQLFSELAKHFDPLTGLDKAEFVQEKAAEILGEGKEIAVIFLDIDNFGIINKEFGHVVGDEILQQVARILKGLITEETDFLCRYAGDEFVVLTVRPLEEAEKLAWQMVTALSEASWPHGVRVTVSAGVAGGRRSFARPEENPGRVFRCLLNMASLASTRAKKEKKKVLVAGQLELEDL